MIVALWFRTENARDCGVHVIDTTKLAPNFQPTVEACAKAEPEHFGPQRLGLRSS